MGAARPRYARSPRPPPLCQIFRRVDGPPGRDPDGLRPGHGSSQCRAGLSAGAGGGREHSAGGGLASGSLCLVETTPTLGARRVCSW